MGYGWSHTYGATIQPAVSIEGQTFLKITDATGRGVYFYRQSSDQYRGVFHERSHVNLEGPEYVWYRLDGSRYGFHRSGFQETGELVWIEDQYGNRIYLQYDRHDRLEMVYDNSSGRTLNFHYFDNGRRAT